MRAQWRLTLEAAKDEALLAVDLYNQPKGARKLEGFFVHMHMAWLYLFIGKYQRDKQGFHYRLLNGRYDRVDGERKTWDLAKFCRENWPENHPVRKNLEFTIALRHRIEHRYAEATAVATAGYAQALLLNFEHWLTSTFGSDHTLGDDLRFPVFVGAFSREGAARIAVLQQSLPKRTKRFLTEFESGIDASVREDQHFEFRIHLIPKTGPKTDADVAMTFVRASDLSEDQRAALADIGHTGTLIVREQIRNVANVNTFKPGEVSKKVQERIPFKFSVHSHFARAWKALDVRPKTSAEHPERTKTDYCVYDMAHQDYVYTETFIEKLVSQCQTPEDFYAFLGIWPASKPDSR